MTAGPADARWTLAVDHGTTMTRAAAADLDPADGWLRVGAVCTDPSTGAADLPSVVLSRPDGALFTGRAALAAGHDDPAAAVLRARSHLAVTGDPPEVLTTWPRPTTAVDVATALVATVLRAESARRGGPPAALVLLHPAGWAPPARRALAAAGRAAMAALPPADPDTVRLLETPRAAAHRVGGAGPVLVADLGGGGTELTVVDRDADALVGDPVAVSVGAEAVDDALAQLVLDRAPTDLAGRVRFGGDHEAHRAWYALRTGIREAKEILGAHGSVAVPLPVLPPENPGSATVTLTHGDLVALLGPGLEEIAQAVERIAANHPAPPPLLVRGGLAELPRVRTWLAERTGSTPAHGADAGAVAAVGAVSGAVAWAADRIGLGREPAR